MTKLEGSSDAPVPYNRVAVKKSHNLMEVYDYAENTAFIQNLSYRKYELRGFKKMYLSKWKRVNLWLSWAPSGSGKTTLLNCISCYIPFDKGEIRLGDENLASLSENELAHIRNQKLGFVFQDFMLLDGLTVRDNIMLPRIISGRIDSSMEKEADRLCGIFGITHISGKYPAEISGVKNSEPQSPVL